MTSACNRVLRVSGSSSACFGEGRWYGLQQIHVDRSCFSKRLGDIHERARVRTVYEALVKNGQAQQSMYTAVYDFFGFQCTIKNKLPSASFGFDPR